jgi:hypothetical protein
MDGSDLMKRRGMRCSTRGYRPENGQHWAIHRCPGGAARCMAVLEELTGVAHPRGSDAWEMMGRLAKWRGDYTELTYAVDALGKTAVRAGGDGSFLQPKADGGWWLRGFSDQGVGQGGTWGLRQFSLTQWWSLGNFKSSW